VGSIANLIVVDRRREERHHHRLEAAHARIGIPVTL
jgi:hypothetical protein